MINTLKLGTELISFDQKLKNNFLNGIANNYYESLPKANGKSNTEIKSDLEKLSFKVTYTEELKKVVDDNDICSNVSYRRLYEDITYDSSIAKIDSLSLNDTIVLAESMHKDYISTFYGVLVRFIGGGGEFFNPLHPIVANEIINSNFDLNQMCEVIVYTSESDFNFNEQEVEQERSNIISILASINIGEVETRLTIKNYTHSSMNNTMNINYRAFDEFDNEVFAIDSTFRIVPNQILNRAIIAPYYGISLVSMEDGCLGEAALTKRMQSANTRFDSFGAVCTGGNGNGRTGVETLNHSNLNSPLRKDILLEGFHNLTIASIRTSFELYEPWLVKSVVVPPLQRISFDEWKLLDESNENIIDYLKLISKIKAGEL